MTILTLKAKNDYLQKVASTRDYVKAISEFVWNSLDADTTEVSVELARNALGGLDSIIIRDNGTGITSNRAAHLRKPWRVMEASKITYARFRPRYPWEGRTRPPSILLACAESQLGSGLRREGKAL
jgi:hypothetical protein